MPTTIQDYVKGSTVIEKWGFIALKEKVRMVKMTVDKYQKQTKLRDKILIKYRKFNANGILWDSRIKLFTIHNRLKR